MTDEMDFVSINDVNVYPFESDEELLDYIDKHKGILVAINTQKVVYATDQTREIINRNIGYCDGAGVVLMLKRKGFENAKKIAGCDLWLKIVQRFCHNKSFYLIGGKQQVIEQVVNKLNKDYDGIKIAGFRNGYLDNHDDELALIDEVVLKKPDVVFVAMGSPKQELLMERLQEAHPNAIYQGLGGSFDVYTGNVPRAPKWWIDHDLEYAYRLIKQPSRFKRYFCLFKFAWWLIIKKV